MVLSLEYTSAYTSFAMDIEFSYNLYKITDNTVLNRNVCCRLLVRVKLFSSTWYASQQGKINTTSRTLGRAVGVFISCAWCVSLQHNNQPLTLWCWCQWIKMPIEQWQTASINDNGCNYEHCTLSTDEGFKILLIPEVQRRTFHTHQFVWVH
jgi:hypothetical protein